MSSQSGQMMFATCTIPLPRLTCSARLHTPDRPDPPNAGKTVQPGAPALTRTSLNRLCITCFMKVATRLPLWASMVSASCQYAAFGNTNRNAEPQTERKVSPQRQGQKDRWARFWQCQLHCGGHCKSAGRRSQNHKKRRNARAQLQLQCDGMALGCLGDKRSVSTRLKT